MTVEPIRDMQKIKQMYGMLFQENPKYALMFRFGLNTGLRISDILPIKRNDVFNRNGKFHDYLVLIEKKTEKEKKIKLNSTLKREIVNYCEMEKTKESPYFFYSNKGGHLTRVQAYRVLKKAASACGIENFGTHSLRKTWGYWTYKTSKYNIGLIMEMFNHSSARITLRYIGVSQDQKDQLYSMVQF